MKPSRFNVMVERDAETAAIYNTLSGQTLELPRATAGALQGDGASASLRARHLLAPDLQVRALTAGMLVPDDVDESQVPIWQQQRRRLADDELRVLVLTTRHCNLRCPYCYEAPLAKSAGTMSAATAARVVNFVTGLLAERRCRRATVGFYGGEPLLNVPAILSIAEPLAALARARAVPLEFPLTTNGALLAGLRGERLFALVTSVHVTLEGAREVHDGIRRRADGRGSYDAILAGITRVLAHGTRLIVRLHANGLAPGSLTRMLDDLAAAGLTPGARASIYTTSFAACQSVSAEGCRRELVSARSAALESAAPLVAEARAHALAALVCFDDQAPQQALTPRVTGCAFSGLRAWAVDANGDLYKCPDNLRPEARLGTLDSQGRPRWTSRYLELAGARYWPGAACARCEFLPVCGAGCILAPVPQRFEDCAVRPWYRAAVEHHVRARTARRAPAARGLPR